MTADVDAHKKQLRQAAMRARAEAAATASNAGARVADAFLAAAPRMHLPPAPESVAAFWPMADEIDVRPLIRRLHDAGYRIGLPVMQGSAAPLTFRQWRPGADLVDGGFGTRIPSQATPEIVPRALIVPLLAFDLRGFRLGYGGGFYDRTLAALQARGPVAAIGVAYAAQQVEAVPRDAHDVALRWIVTELGAVETEAAACAS